MFNKRLPIREPPEGCLFVCNFWRESGDEMSRYLKGEGE